MGWRSVDGAWAHGVNYRGTIPESRFPRKPGADGRCTNLVRPGPDSIHLDVAVTWRVPTVSESNPIRIFVSHLFTEDPDYLRVFEFLENVDRFYYLNCSRPDNQPPGGLEAMKDELIAQIKEAEAIIILAWHYQQNEELVRFQLDVAEANEKPIIVIRPFGGIAETPPALVERAHEHMEWNEREIADALRRQARMEDTTRWDVIDFP